MIADIVFCFCCACNVTTWLDVFIRKVANGENIKRDVLMAVGII